MMSGIKQYFIAATLILAFARPPISDAAENSAPLSPSSDSAGSNTDNNTGDMNKTIKKESSQPMNLDEPMPTGMAKKGMKKGDVKAHAMKKAASMDELMKQEKMKK